jgi:WD40 repeat protein
MVKDENAVMIRIALVITLFLIATELPGTPAQPQWLPSVEPIDLENIDWLTELMQAGRGRITHISLSPDGRHLALAGRFGIHVYDLNDPGATSRLIGNEYGTVFNVLFRPDWSWVAISTLTSLSLLDLETGDHVLDMDGLPGGLSTVHVTANELVLSGTGRWLAMTRGLDGGQILIWDVASGEQVFWNEHRYGVESPVFAPQDSSFAYNYRELSPAGSGFSTYNAWFIVSTLDWNFFAALDQVTGFGAFDVSPFDRSSGENPFSSRTEWIRGNHDGSVLVSADTNGEHIWNVLDGTLVSTLPETYRFRQFSPDGRLLITTTDTRELTLVEPLSGQSRHITADNDFTQFAFSLDAISLAALDRTVQTRIVDVVSGQEKILIETGYLGSINEMVFNEDGRHLYFTDNDSNLRYLDMTTGEIVLIAYVPDGTGNIAFSPLLSLIAFGAQNGDIYLYDAETGEVVDMLIGHEHPISDIAFHPDGMTLASSSIRDTVRIWDVTSGEVEILPHDYRSIDGLTFNPDGTQLLMIDPDNGKGAILYDMNSREQLAHFPASGWLSAAVTGFSANNERVAVGANGVWIWPADEALSAEPLHVFAGQGLLRDFTLNRTGDLLFAAHTDLYIQIYNTVSAVNSATGEILLELEDFQDAINAVALSPDGRYLALGGADGMIRLWGVPSNE